MRHFRESAAAVMVAALIEGTTTMAVHAQSGAALEGVSTVSVVVSMNSYESTPAGIDLDLRTLAGSRLTANGWRVLNPGQVEEMLEASRTPVLRITLLGLPVPNGGQSGYAYSLAIQLTETGRAPTSRALANVELWSASRLNVTSVALARGDIERDLTELLEQLLSAWRTANRRA